MVFSSIRRCYPPGCKKCIILSFSIHKRTHTLYSQADLRAYTGLPLQLRYSVDSLHYERCEQ